MIITRALALFSVIFCVFTANAQFSQGGLDDVFDDQPEFLPVEEAFQFDFEQRNDTLFIHFQIAEGYYLYKKQFKTKLKDVELGEPAFPEAVQIEDEFFGISDVFYDSVTYSYPILASKKDGRVTVRFQGCAEAGLCYPPTVKQVYLNAVAGSVTAGGTNTSSATAPAQSEQFDLAEQLASGDSLTWTLAGFLGLGILLAFTPCVFPMYPILSGIVLGSGKSIKTGHAFSLSFTYVQGMAITYSLLGLAVASMGVKFQAALQNEILLSVFIAIFIALAFAMFGAYELQLPSKWQERLNALSNQQKSGNVVGVFVMGMLSGFIASPCTTAPLTAILLYIAQTGDMFLGFISLYVLSIGMGIPLILFGVTGGKLLPKAGNWMNVVKTTFGFMMLAVAVFFLERIWISDYSLLLYAGLGIAAFSYYFVMNQDSATSLWKGIRTGTIFLGLFASAMLGYEVLFPSTGYAPQSAQSHGGSSSHPEFLLVKDLNDFQAKLAAANADGKSVMVDLYADWCVACKEFEKFTFPEPAVVAALSNTVWMQIDLTDNTPQSLEFQDHFDVLGLPTILFFDVKGTELSKARVTGFMRAEPFAAHVNQWL